MKKDASDQNRRRNNREREIKISARKWFIATTIIFLVLELSVLYLFSGLLGFFLSFITDFSLFMAIVMLLIHIVLILASIGFLTSECFLGAVSSKAANADNQWGKVFLWLGILTAIHLAITMGLHYVLLWISYVMNVIMVIVLSRRTMNYDRRKGNPSQRDIPKF